ncbi:MAG: hypothetical protein WAO58_02725 [Fimbriimonadaceae bacterium]
MRNKIVFSLALGLLAAVGLAQGPDSLTGKKAPNITVKPLFNTEKIPGGGTNLAKLRGKVVVLDFWAFW